MAQVASNQQYAHKKDPDFSESSVVWGGIEPLTQGFSILCSAK